MDLCAKPCYDYTLYTLKTMSFKAIKLSQAFWTTNHFIVTHSDQNSFGFHLRFRIFRRNWYLNWGHCLIHFGCHSQFSYIFCISKYQMALMLHLVFLVKLFIKILARQWIGLVSIRCFALFSCKSVLYKTAARNADKICRCICRSTDNSKQFSDTETKPFAYKPNARRVYSGKSENKAKWN